MGGGGGKCECVRAEEGGKKRRGGRERLESRGGWGQGRLARAADGSDGLVAQPGFIISH